MQAVFETIRVESRDKKQSHLLEVSKDSLGDALSKQEWLLIPTGYLSAKAPSMAFAQHELSTGGQRTPSGFKAEVSVGNTRKIRNFSFSVKMIRSFESSKNRMEARWRCSSHAMNNAGAQRMLSKDEVPQNLWLTSIFNYGGHLGHKSTRVPVSRVWFPSMGDYLVGSRNKVAVINSHLALERVAKGLYLSATVLRRKGHILVIDTRGEASPLPNLIENSNHNIPSSISFSGPRWVGGTLTNWASISVMVRRCAQISKQFDGIITQNRTHIPRYEKMRNAFPGFIKTSSLHGADKWASDPLFAQHALSTGRRFVGHPWPSKGRPTSPLKMLEDRFSQE